MTAPQTTDPQSIIAAFQERLDAGLAREAALAEKLAAQAAEMATHTAESADRKSEFDERIGHQAATIDVLRVMAASPSDTLPVFNLITRRAAELCESSAALYELREGQLDYMAGHGMSLETIAAYRRNFPRPLDRSLVVSRAILERRTIHVQNVATDTALSQAARDLGGTAIAAIPLLRDGEPIGAVALNGRQPGGFSESQIALLQTFAEQAVIAITSAETYRALQTRTSDLQESLEYQTATSDVLKVISRSTFDLQPILDTLVKTATRLCDADMAAIGRPEGDLWRLAANFGFPPEFEGAMRARGAYPLDPDSPTVAARAVRERRAVHIHDAAAVPGYPDRSIGLGKQRTSLGVPLLREGEAIGHIVLARQRVEPFTERQIELVSTFADQAVIAIENTRLITEQREALEQQTATAEVLQVINASPGNLAPVFDAILEKAHDLCGATKGALVTFDGQHFRAVVTRGLSETYAQMLREPRSTTRGSLLERLLNGASFVLEDTSTSPLPLPRAATELEGVRTVLIVPLRRDSALLGYITALSQEVRPFTEKHIALLQNFAAQAVIAMENARLITEQREALEQQTATAEVLQVINASPGDLAPVFDAILEKAHHLCGAVHGVFGTYNGDYFRAVASRGLPTAVLERLKHGFHGLENPITRPLFDGARFVQIPDLSEIDHPIPKAVSALGGFRTALFVPLRKDGTLLGHITALRSEVRPFTDKQIALLENFASQAVIAMENARLITEQREALEQQTATAQVLQIINGSPGNLTPVFDAMLEKAMRLCEAPFGSLYTYDGESFRSAAQRGVPLAYAEFRAKNPPTLVPGSGTETLVATKRTFHVLDVKARDNYRTGDPGARAMVDLGGIRTLLSVPLIKDDALVGFFSIYRQEVRAFSDRQIELLENFAAQAVIAMENARLITETREALERQTATAEVLRIINENPGNLGPVFDVILEKALSLAEAAFGSLWIYHGDTMHAAATRGMTPALAEFRARNPVLAVPPVAREASETRRAVQMLDIRESESYRAGRRASRAIADLGGARTNLVVPLLKDNEGVGCIQIYRQEVRVFTPQQISLLEGFAAQAVIAMDNARLLNEIRQRQNELDITFENMGDGVAMFDRDQRLAAWNRNFQDILNLPDEAVRVGLPFADYIRGLAARGEYGPDANADEQIARLTIAVGQANRFERTRPNGRVIDVRHNLIQDGGFVVIYADITERKRAEEALRVARDEAETALRELKVAQANLVQAEKMASLGQLTAGIAHEIKNPLNFVNNFAALSVDLLSELKETAAPGFATLTDKQRAEVEEVSVMLTGNLEKISEHGKRADGIVKAMLEHSRGSSGERRTVDLNALIDEALNLAYHGARAQDQSFNIALEREFGEGIAPIEVNPQDITRVFLNLFANGFYATTRRARGSADAGFVPTLKVTTIDETDAVEVRVRDNGTGIPADIRDKLFQPFFTTKPTGEGTGLGLSITYDIVTQQHGGSIAVDSKVGDYSEFVIRLPRKQ